MTTLHKLAKDWPKVDGRSATVEEVTRYVAKVEAHYATPRYRTEPHFCPRCTCPLEFEPCPIDFAPGSKLREDVERMKKMLEKVRS